ncbi:transcription factor E2F6 isoform X2 [Rhizophagus clarus]|uniref:Transcription factor E2F6 isoform X2 n=1 Tax=Rhizophagus clarus TaxID=94130 RepID=A0A8H3MDJ7_9GLOM|nr:transcription factor E2F6 isoform X2 [Rhizophagus clarus]
MKERTLTLPSFENTLNEQEKINKEIVKAFTYADIPLEKIEKLKPFLLNYSGLITGANQLRVKYLLLSYKIALQKLKNDVINKIICLTIDETTDRCGRHAVNILFSFDNKTKLAKTEFLSNVNASSISQFVMNTIHFYNISYENIIFFISDNASYMKLAYSNLSPFLPNLKYNCCLVHILNLIGKAWEHLLQNGIESPTLAPLPVKTRWNSWFLFLCWIKPLYFHLITFVTAEYSINHNSKAVRDLYTFCQNRSHVFCVKIFIYFITYNSKRLINDLEFFKIRNKAIAPFVYLRIVSLQAFLSSGTRNPPISNEIFQLLNEENQDIASFVSLFSRAFILANEKCEKHISYHPALLFFKAIQCFDPKFIQSNSSNHNIENYRIIKEFCLPTDTLIQEWAIYCGLNESIEEFDDLDLYWRGKKHILPELSSLALIYIWLPVSDIDIERSFSSYKSILSDRRVALKEENIQMLNFLYFNLIC